MSCASEIVPAALTLQWMLCFSNLQTIPWVCCTIRMRSRTMCVNDSLQLGEAPRPLSEPPGTTASLQGQHRWFLSHYVLRSFEHLKNCVAESLRDTLDMTTRCVRKAHNNQTAPDNLGRDKSSLPDPQNHLTLFEGGPAP